MFPTNEDRESFEKAKVEFQEVDNWCLANEGEINKSLQLDLTGRISSLAISKILNGKLMLAFMAGKELDDAVSFGIAFGIYLAKKGQEGTKVPDIFKED